MTPYCVVEFRCSCSMPDNQFGSSYCATPGEAENGAASKATPHNTRVSTTTRLGSLQHARVNDHSSKIFTASEGQRPIHEHPHDYGANTTLPPGRPPALYQFNHSCTRLACSSSTLTTTAQTRRSRQASGAVLVQPFLHSTCLF